MASLPAGPVEYRLEGDGVRTVVVVPEAELADLRVAARIVELLAAR
uniref:Uncharacterized protein n=1 Tax=Nonomuraea gerenzanensis TaxID=93944 RepID=A0A1M4EBK4_9ACTN|nr:hypothetical protein BN4615_P5795 [Nonomuraea gerenzanensis]